MSCRRRQCRVVPPVKFSLDVVVVWRIPPDSPVAWYLESGTSGGLESGV